MVGEGEELPHPLDLNRARKLISEILNTGGVVEFWSHCHKALADDGLDTVDATNVLRCGRLHEPAEFSDKHQQWRYRVHTEKMSLVVIFVSKSELGVVSAWRKKS